MACRPRVANVVPRGRPGATHKLPSARISGARLHEMSPPQLLVVCAPDVLEAKRTRAARSS